MNHAPSQFEDKLIGHSVPGRCMHKSQQTFPLLSFVWDQLRSNPLYMKLLLSPTEIKEEDKGTCISLQIQTFSTWISYLGIAEAGSFGQELKLKTAEKKVPQQGKVYHKLWLNIDSVSQLMSMVLKNCNKQIVYI